MLQISSKLIGGPLGDDLQLNQPVYVETRIYEERMSDKKFEVVPDHSATFSLGKSSSELLVHWPLTRFFVKVFRLLPGAFRVVFEPSREKQYHAQKYRSPLRVRTHLLTRVQGPRTLFEPNSSLW